MLTLSAGEKQKAAQYLESTLRRAFLLGFSPVLRALDLRHQVAEHGRQVLHR